MGPCHERCIASLVVVLLLASAGVADGRQEAGITAEMESGRLKYGDQGETQSTGQTRSSADSHRSDRNENGMEQEKEEEEEEEEEEEFTEVDLAESLMLLGGISFVMMMFYLVNHEDKDMKYYSWSVISATISIFAAVLIYTGINNLTHKYVMPKDLSEPGKVAFAFAETMLYFVCLQVGSALEVGAGRAKIVDIGDGKATKKEIKRQKEQIERRTICWATIFAHLTGFASIHCGATLQELNMIRTKPMLAFLAPPIMFIFSVLLNWLARRARERFAADAQEYQKVALQETGSGGETEQDMEDRKWAQELWHECVIDAEHDIAGLSVSFLIVQACRFNISGILPDSMGVEKGSVESANCSLKLMALALSFALATALMVLAIGRLFGGKPPEPGSLQSFLRRCMQVAQNSLAMAFAWSLLYAARWEIGRQSAILGPATSISSRVVLALAISVVAFLMTRALDCISDLEATGKDADKALVSIITALGVLVGFSWEQSFDGGVEVIAERTAHPKLAELGLALFVVTLLLPAWRRYILHTVIKLGKERREPGGEAEHSRTCSRAE